MPVTTRAAALKSQANGDLIRSQDKATSISTSTVKTTRKCSSRQKEKPAHVQPVISCAESEIYSPSQQESTTLDAGSVPEVIHRSDYKDVVLQKDDATLEILLILFKPRLIICYYFLFVNLASFVIILFSMPFSRLPCYVKK